MAQVSDQDIKCFPQFLRALVNAGACGGLLKVHNVDERINFPHGGDEKRSWTALSSAKQNMQIVDPSLWRTHLTLQKRERIHYV